MTNPTQIMENVLSVHLDAMTPEALETLERYVNRSSDSHTAEPLGLTESDAAGIVGKDGTIHAVVMELLPTVLQKMKVIRTLTTLETKEVVALNLAMMFDQSIKSVYGYDKMTPLLGDNGEVAPEYRQWVKNWLSNQIRVLF
jgi:hypothetical protein